MADILDWTANEGFAAYTADLGARLGEDMDWDSAHQFRQRYQLEALANLRGSRT